MSTVSRALESESATRRCGVSESSRGVNVQLKAHISNLIEDGQLTARGNDDLAETETESSKGQCG
jgi:hypothetical protein